MARKKAGAELNKKDSRKDGAELKSNSGSQRQPEGQQNRRFPRILLQSTARPLTLLLGAKLVWPTGDRLDVTDLSYIGVAAVRNSRLTPRVGERCTLRLELAGHGDLEIEAEVARVTDRLIAIHFGKLETAARRALERFLQIKLIGLHMQPVDSKYFARPGSFTHWFHGPNNANIFLWYENLELVKAAVELGSDFLQWKGGRFYSGTTTQFLTDANGDYLQPFHEDRLKTNQETDRKGLTPLMMRILDLLSQVEDPERTLQPLVDALVARKRQTR